MTAHAYKYKAKLMEELFVCVTDGQFFLLCKDIHILSFYPEVMDIVSHRSFIVEKDDGAEILWNAKLLKHMWQIPKPNHIAWADQQ